MPSTSSTPVPPFIDAPVPAAFRIRMRLRSATLGPVLAFVALAFAATIPGRAAAAEQTFLQIAEGGAAGEGRIETFTRSVPDPYSSSSEADAPLSPFGAASEEGGPLSAAAGFEAPPPTTEALGEQRTLVSLVNFTNDPTSPVLATDLHAAIFDEANPASTASYVREASYGRAWLAGSVMDWISASYADASCLVRTDSGTQQLIDELDPLVDFSQVDRWIIVIPFNASCGFAGFSTLGKIPWNSAEGPVSFSRVILNGAATSVPVLGAHELGHSLVGLQHSNDLECGAAAIGGSCTRPLSDRYSVMGETASGGHFTAPDKYALGWLETELVDVEGAGGIFLLEPYESLPAGGTKVLRIPSSWPVNDYSEAEFIYVSYRKPIGFDAVFTELATDGAMLHLDAHFKPQRPFVTGASSLLDARPGGSANQETDSTDVVLGIGETFVDPVHGITIETLGVAGGQLQISVARSQSCGNGVIDPALFEECDGADLGGQTCDSVGFTSGSLGCSATCEFDTSACGAAQCAVGDDFDPGSQLCAARFLAIGPSDMTYYRNSTTLAFARSLTTATLLTPSRGSFGTTQNFSGTTNSIVTRLLLPFDTSALPDGAQIASATLDLKLDLFWDPYVNSHPDSADQLVLVETFDPDPLTRSLADYAAFVPVDLPVEGAPRIDASESLSAGAPFAFELNAAGLSWIDDQGTTGLGVRTGFDVDDVPIFGELQQLRTPVVPNDSAIVGPRLTVRYAPLPEPGAAIGAAVGALLLAGFERRRRLSIG